MGYHRDVSAGIQLFRTLALGRTWNQQSRFQDMISPRPYPKPSLEIGTAHKAYENYYYDRDARRAVKPAEVISMKQLTAGDSTTTNTATSSSSKGKFPMPTFMK